MCGYVVDDTRLAIEGDPVWDFEGQTVLLVGIVGDLDIGTVVVLMQSVELVDIGKYYERN